MDQSTFSVLVLGELSEADDLFDRKVFVEDYPCECTQVADSEQFSEAISEPAVDVILIDVEPYGIKVLEEVLENRPMRPMVMVANAKQGDVILEAKRLGLERYIIRFEDESLNADLLTEELIFILKRLSEPPSMEHPTVEELFRFAQYHNVRQPFYVVDRTHRLLYANGIGKYLVDKLHDRKLREGDNYDAFPLEDSAEESIAHLDQALGGEKVEVEHTYEQLSEEEKHRELLYQPVRDKSDTVVSVSIACKNIGARRRAQQKLERQKEALWSFFEMVPLPLKIVGHDFTVERANAALSDLLGYEDPKALEGMAIDELVADEDVEQVSQAMNALFEGEAPYSHFEHRYVCKSGKMVWTNHLGFPLRGLGDPDDNPVALVLSANITRQKEAEHREQQSMRLRAIGELAAGVAHDFNNVLSVVTTYGQLLRSQLEEQRDEELFDYVDKILQAVESAMALTHQLLSFGRDDPGSTTLVDVNYRIREVNRLLERSIGSHIDVRTDLAANLPGIQADPSQIDQVLMNLAINARDAMPDGGVLCIRTRSKTVDDASNAEYPDLTNGDYARLEVSDTGEGMDEETRRHIFDPFFTTKSRDDGSGLGLATVYKIVDRIGGHIYVESAPGEGSTFTIYLPASPASHSSSEGGAPPDENTGQANKQACVLLVEDESSLRKSHRDLLESEGHRVLEATNVEEALSTLEDLSEAPDLLITDVTLPDGSGKKVARTLAEQFSDLSVLFISEYAPDVFLEDDETLDVNWEFLPKPLSRETFLSTILDVLGRT